MYAFIGTAGSIPTSRVAVCQRSVARLKDYVDAEVMLRFLFGRYWVLIAVGSLAIVTALHPGFT